MNKIFLPFLTSRLTGDGTGFGLSLAYDIVKAPFETLQIALLAVPIVRQKGAHLYKLISEAKPPSLSKGVEYLPGRGRAGIITIL